MERILMGPSGVCSHFGSANPTWAALTSGKSGIAPITKFDAADLPTQIGSEIVNFMPESIGLNDKNVRREWGEASLYALAAAQEALGRVGLETLSEEESFDVGCLVGCGGSGLPAFEELSLAINNNGYPDKKGSVAFMLQILKFLINMPTGRVSIENLLRGPSETYGDACAAGLKALCGGGRIIRLGEAQAAIVVGTEGTMCRTAFSAFNLMNPRDPGGAMSGRNDDPEGASRPGTVERDGFVMGEGSVAHLLGSEAFFTKHGLTPAAELLGWASTSDAKSMFAPHPNGLGGYEAMHRALKMANIRPEEVDLVVGHLTSTPAGDNIEVAAMKRLFGDHAEQVMVYGPKGQLGHWLGASGNLGVFAATEAFRTGEVPYTLNLTEKNLDPACAGVGHFRRGQKPKIAIVNAFGFGGTNASVVLRKAA